VGVVSLLVGCAGSARLSESLCDGMSVLGHERGSLTMAGLLTVDPDALEAAAARCDALQGRLEECRTEAMNIYRDLEGAYQGEAARAFGEFVDTKAAPILYDTAEMCQQTAAGLRHTVSQFTQADSTMAGVFRAV